MKRTLSVFLVALVLMSLLPFTVSAAGVDITDAFTDANFRRAVYTVIGKTAPAPIYDTDVAGVTHLRTREDHIQSLAGLEYFVGLTDLDCVKNQFTSLPDLPAGLINLDCSLNPQLVSWPALPASLKSLSCNRNQMTSLPALPPGLEKLSCDVNLLTSLPDLPPALKELICSRNNLTSLPALPLSLQKLSCVNNLLTGIDVTGLQLTRLNCEYNLMASEAAVIGFTGWDGKNFIFAPQATKATLNALIAEAKAIKRFKYSCYSWKNLQTAIANAQAAIDNPDASKSDVIAQINDLQAAIKGMEHILDLMITMGLFLLWLPLLLLAYGW